MENKNEKCSNKEHKEINAISYCQKCNVYMCNKCEIFHSKLCENHHSYKLDEKKKEIFTGLCKEENHNAELEFFCKTHNLLCCVACVSKVKKKGKGQHTDCDVCCIEDIKNEKKSKLKENIKILQDISNSIETSINEIKKILEKINNEKEEIKLSINKIFTKIRNTINDREDELLLEIDEKYESFYFNENIIKKSEKLPDKIKESLEKGKIIDKEWNNDNNLNSLINDCINIENNIQYINKINDYIKKYNNSQNYKIEFIPIEDNEINKFCKNINLFEKIYQNNDLENSLIIKNKRQEYINNIINWINPKKNLKIKLLYRKSKDGDSYDIFHKLCDNQGKTLVLIKAIEGFIIGGYTPLDWDKCSGWKNDDETFLFSLTDNKIYRKKKNKNYSIYCGKDIGPWFAYIGFRGTGKKNMTQGEFLYRSKENECEFIDFNKIINKNENKFFDVEEVEVYKVLFD